MNLKMKLLSLSLCAVLSAANPSDITVIANPGVSVSRVSSEELKAIFLSTKTAFADGSRVEPILMKSGDVHEVSVQQYTGKTAAALESYYRSLVFTGKGGMPKISRSDAEMVEYVSKTKGAIGYVRAGANLNGVKVLDVK